MRSKSNFNRSDRKLTVENSCTLDLSWLLSSDIPMWFPLWGLVDWHARWSTAPIASAWYRFLMDEVPDPVLEIVFLGALSSLPSRFRQTVTLATTLMPRGGQRWWLLCPHCNSKRTKLYLPRGGGSFLCRACHNLAYYSTQECHRWDSVYDIVAKKNGISRQAAKRRLEGIAKSWAQESAEGTSSACPPVHNL